MIQSEIITRDFPSLSGKAYMNTAAEGIPPRVVVEAVEAYLEDKREGMRGRDAHFAREQEAKQSVSQLIGLTPQEIGFCSCSAEAYNLLSTALALRENEEVVINDLDFPSGATPWLVGQNHPRVRVWKSRNGVLHLDDLTPLLNVHTRLVQVSLVSFYNGWRLPWLPFIQRVREIVPDTIVSVDLTQALGRCVLDCSGADILISSTHKWLLGLHGGCVVGIPTRSAEKLTTTAGGWYHLQNAFDADRFERAVSKSGAASYAVGMPSFAPIYALHAAADYLLSVDIKNIAHHADPLVQAAHAGLTQRGIRPLAPFDPACSSGIVAFRHPESEKIQEALLTENIHIMHQAGRMRLALHGYNQKEDLDRLFHVLDRIL